MSLLAQAASVFGEVSPPPGVSAYNQKAAQAGGEIGLLLFISNLIKVLTVGAGLFVLFNIIYAGFLYIESMGKTEAHVKVRDQITNSILGLLLIVGSYALAAIIGMLFFGDATYIINPKICGPQGC